MWRVDSPAAVCGLSNCSTWAPECVGVGSCSTWAQLLCGTWDLPRPGIEPVSSALASRFLSTRPPGKPSNISFYFSGVGEQKYLVKWWLHG